MTSDGLSTPSPQARDLMLGILRCQHLEQALDPLGKHPCRKVVGAQWSVPIADRRRRFAQEHELPEPWSGEIEHALILFVSSNPSGSSPSGVKRRGETGPRASCTDDALVDYYHRRFETEIVDGRYHANADGSRGKYQPFWGGTNSIAKQLLPGARPGRDYVLTELVRCKSQDERGVDDALSTCSEAYLKRTLALAGNAQVIVALGKKARGWFQTHAKPCLADSSTISCVEEVRLDVWPERTFTLLALGHPSGGEMRSPERVLPPDQLERVRERLRTARG